MGTEPGLARSLLAFGSFIAVAALMVGFGLLVFVVSQAA